MNLEYASEVSKFLGTDHSQEILDGRRLFKSLLK